MTTYEDIKANVDTYTEAVEAYDNIREHISSIFDLWVDGDVSRNVHIDKVEALSDEDLVERLSTIMDEAIRKRNAAQSQLDIHEKMLEGNEEYQNLRRNGEKNRHVKPELEG
jgi:uncharacterized protein YajQ (UPF0234 family)